MKSPLVVLGLVVACAAPSPTPAPGPDLAAEERAIRATDSTWLAAAVRHDAAGEAAALFADDAIAYRDQPDPITGPAAYQPYSAKYYLDNPKVVESWVTRSITIAASGACP